MKTNRDLIQGMGIGAGLMYFFDPNMGRRRRALVNDRLTHWRRVGTSLLAKGLRDLEQRTHGFFIRAQALFETEIVPDRILAERIRSKIGRVIPNPHMIEVKAESGRVTLSGPILRHRALDLIQCVTKVRGVCIVEDNLEVHEYPDGISSLQTHSRTLTRPGWFSTPRLISNLLLAGLTSSAAYYGLFKRNFWRFGLSATSFFALNKASQNKHKTVNKKRVAQSPPLRVAGTP